MKKHMIISLAFILVLVAVPVIVFAQFGSTASTYRPIGGIVIDSGAGGSAVITCVAPYGPLTIRSFIAAVPGPYFIRSANGGSPRTGGYILGLYSVAPDVGTCFNTETGVPIPAYEIRPYGVSR